MLFEAWNKHGFGPLLTPPSYEIQENDVPIAFSRLVDALWKSGNGLKTISRFLAEVLTPVQFARDHAYDVLVVRDPKTYLQEFMQAAFKHAPRYETRQDSRSAQHRPIFTASVRVPTVGIVEEQDSSISEATGLAAESAIVALKNSQSASERLLVPNSGAKAQG